MSDDGCNNGCTLPLSFPRRPGENPPSAHGEGCFCCTPETRISSDNRPALPHFNYRIGSYGTIREWLLNRIDQTPNLRNWTHRAPDDPAIALLEGASILGDILTFYQEAYANEAFLRTAKGRESIADLVRLLGYRLSPAVGGKATFAFELKKDEAVVIPAGFPLKATLEELPKPAEFETGEEITAYPSLSRFNLYRPLLDGDITPSTTSFYISYPEQLTEPIELKVGDRLLVSEADWISLLFTGSLVNAETAIVDSITELHGRKTIKIKGNLKRTGNAGSLYAYRLGRSFNHFARNHPGASANSVSTLMIDSTKPVTSTATVNTTTNTTTTTSTIPKVYVPMVRSLYYSLYNPDSTVSMNFSNLEFPLDYEVKDIATGSAMIFEFGYRNSYRQTNLPHVHMIRSITDIRSSALTWGMLSGTTSIMTISSSLNNTILDPYYGGTDAFMYMSDAVFHEVLSPIFVLQRAKAETAAAAGNTLNFYGTAEQVKTLDGRRIMFDRPDEEPQIVTVTGIPAAFNPLTEEFPQLYPLTLSEDVSYADFPNENPAVTVFGNLADADEGKTLPEVSLGSGNATQIFQNFKVPKAPLTYHIVPENTPPETPEAEIYVDGRMWTKVDSFFGRGAEEQIYIIREDADGNSWVQFGDGKTGARLPSGVKNVTAIYRTGSGAYGELKADTKVQASAKIKNLDKIGMPGVVSGGSEQEDGENARYAAPGKVQSLGRIVSLKDFESEASAIAGVASASAAWQLVENAPAVVVTLLMETGRGAEIGAVSDTLRSYNTLRGAGRFSVLAHPGKRMYVTVSVQYALKAGYRADLVEPEIRRALGVNFALATGKEDQTGLFSLRQRKFGGREYASSIAGVTQNVDGVLWAKATAFSQLADGDDPAALVLPSPSVLWPIVPCDAEHILSLYDKHLFLTAVAEAS